MLRKSKRADCFPALWKRSTRPEARSLPSLEICSWNIAVVLEELGGSFIHKKIFGNIELSILLKVFLLTPPVSVLLLPATRSGMRERHKKTLSICTTWITSAGKIGNSAKYFAVDGILTRSMLYLSISSAWPRRHSSSKSFRSWSKLLKYAESRIA